MIQNNNDNQKDLDFTDAEKIHKIESLRDMINSAEKTIQSAKAMLLQLEGKKKTGRKKKVEDTDGQVVEGVFDGQIMIGTDGRQYPVPANYASKSKLIEGDSLKLTITTEGSFVYKQIGPAERRNALGIVSQDESGNYFIIAEGKSYRVLLASITYFKAEPGDEVAIVLPRNVDSAWASIENIVQKGKERNLAKFEAVHLTAKNDTDTESEFGELKEGLEEKTAATEEEAPVLNQVAITAPGQTLPNSVIDEWTPDIKAIEKEIQSAQGV